MTEFNQRTIKQFRSEFENFVKKFEKDHGIKIKLGNGNFTHNSLSVKLTADIVSTETKNNDITMVTEWNALKTFQKTLRLTEAQVGGYFRLNGDRFRLVGYKTRARKSPMLIQDVNKRHYGMSQSMLNKVEWETK